MIETAKHLAKRVLCILLAAGVLVGCAGQGAQKSYKVGILQLAGVLAEVEEGFKAGMADLGYTEGENVTYVYRNADFNVDGLGPLAQEIVAEEVDLLVTITTPASIVAMNVSQGTEIPIVFILVSDPVRAGLVDSLTQPGGRVTGIRDGGTETTGKRLELLKRMAPDAKKVLSVYSSEESLLPAEEKLRQAADKLGLELVERQVNSLEETVATFGAVQPGEVDAIFMPSDPVVANAQEAMVALAVRDGLPYIYPGKLPGVLASYGENFEQVGTQAAALADKVLRGSEPASLPVEIGKKFDFVIDLRVAEQMGVTIPEDVLNIADVVLD